MRPGLSRFQSPETRHAEVVPLGIGQRGGRDYADRAAESDLAKTCWCVGRQTLGDIEPQMQPPLLLRWVRISDELQPEPSVVVERRVLRMRTDEWVDSGSTASVTTAAIGPEPEYSSRGSRTQNSFPSGSASTTHGTEVCPMSTRWAPRPHAHSTNAAWCFSDSDATSRCCRFFSLFSAVDGKNSRTLLSSIPTTLLLEPLTPVERPHPSNCAQKRLSCSGSKD